MVVQVADLAGLYSQFCRIGKAVLINNLTLTLSSTVTLLVVAVLHVVLFTPKTWGHQSTMVPVNPPLNRTTLALSSAYFLSSQGLPSDAPWWSVMVSRVLASSPHPLHSWGTLLLIPCPGFTGGPTINVPSTQASLRKNMPFTACRPTGAVPRLPTLGPHCLYCGLASCPVLGLSSVLCLLWATYSQ